MWCINGSLIRTEPAGEPAGTPYPFLPVLLFEQIYYVKLRALLKFASTELGLSGPWILECGLVGIKNLHLPIKVTQYLQWWGPIHKTEIVHRVELPSADREVLDGALLEFFSRLYEATGNFRPEGLHGFPPDRPR
jgi:hypothetical protein